MQGLDLVSFFLNRTCSIFVAGTTFVLAFTYEDSPVHVCRLVGALVTAGVGKVAKVIFRVKRPVESLRREEIFSYAFPSSHANALFYFVAFLSLEAHTRYSSRAATALVALITTAYTLIVLYARVCIDKDHTIYQCLGGALLGLACGVAAYIWLLPLCERDSGLGVGWVFKQYVQPSFSGGSPRDDM